MGISSSKITMSAGEIVQTGTSTPAAAIYLKGASFTCTGGKVDAQEAALYVEYNVVNTVEISGGEFYGHCDGGSGHRVATINLYHSLNGDKSAAENSKETTFKISGNTYVEGDYRCMECSNGKVTIEGGTFVCKNNGLSALRIDYTGYNTASVKDGNFYSNSNSDVYIYNASKAVDTSLNADKDYGTDITITGGNYRNKTLDKEGTLTDITTFAGTGYSWSSGTTTIDGRAYYTLSNSN
jgi:hypothetical protein